MKIVLILLFFVFFATMGNATPPNFEVEIRKTNSERGKWIVTIKNMSQESVFIANPDLGHVVIPYKNQSVSAVYNGGKNKPYEDDFYKNLALLNSRRDMDNKHSRYVFYLPDIGVDFSDKNTQATICIWSWKGAMKNKDFDVTFFPLQYKINPQANQ